MSNQGRPRRTSDDTWKRIAHQISRLSTESSLDVTLDPSIPVAYPSVSRRAHLPTIQNTLKICFQVQAASNFGCFIGLIGSIPELGQWNIGQKLILTTKPEDYPLWRSPVVEIATQAKVLLFEYKYIYIENVTATQNGKCFWENIPGNHRLEVKFFNSRTVHWSVLDQFNTVDSHVLDVRRELPVLQSISNDGSLYESLQDLGEYFERKGADVTLSEYLTLSHLFRLWASEGVETDSHQSLELMSNFTDTLLAYTTEAYLPVIRDVLLGMTKCSIPFWKLTHSILDRTLVESSRVPLGCESEEVLEFLTDFLNVSQSSEEGTARALILNSIRRSLKVLLSVSSSPALLCLYDMCLEEAEMTYIHDNFEFGKSENLLMDVHKITIILDALALANICPRECESYSRTLETIWTSYEGLAKGHFESIKAVLLDILRTFLKWVDKYTNPEALAGVQDLLNMKEILTSIASRYTQLLFPMLTRALQKIDQKMHILHYLPMRCGTAVGKVMKVASVSDVPETYVAVIAIVSQKPISSSVPKNVKALLLLKDIEFDSELLSHCHARNIILAVISEGWIPMNLEACVQVQVFDDVIEFI